MDDFIRLLSVDEACAIARAKGLSILSRTRSAMSLLLIQ